MATNIKGYNRPARQSPLSEIIRAYSLIDSLNQNEFTETPVQQDAMATYSSFIFNSFDDNSFNTHVNQLDNWYNNNLNDLDAGDIERYELIKRRASEHQTRYKTFDASYKFMHDDVEDMKLLLAGGIDNEGNTITPYNELSEQSKILTSEIIKQKEIAYIQNMEQFNKRFGDLLNHPSGKFTTESTALDSWDDIYQLGLVSIEDQVLDKEELYTLSRSIDYGNLDEFNNYKGIKEQTQIDSQRFIVNDAQPLISEVNYKGKLIDDYEYITNLADAASKGDSKAERELNTIGDKIVHTTETNRNDYANNLPTGMAEQKFTWNDLLNGEALQLINIYESDIENIRGTLFQYEQGFKNVAKGQSLTQSFPITYKGWNNQITDPYIRLEIDEEKTTQNKVNQMTVQEQKLINDYEKDYKRKTELEEWFEKYPTFGSSPEEAEVSKDYTGESAGKIAQLKEEREAKRQEIRGFKAKWYKTQEQSYGGATYKERAQSSAYSIYRRYNLTPIGLMFD
jgi:hypothetical protein